RTLQATFRKYALVSVAGTVVLAAVLPFAIPFVYGRAFAGAVSPALVLLAAGLCLGAKQVLAGGAQALGDPWLASRSEIIGAVVTICLLPVLLPRLGIMGAALATLAAYATQLVVVLAGLSRTHAIGVPSLMGARPRRA
nr:polysaccharide biosynthesis C-terminal domain-containing protein [Candidatus Eremiobacteraeota bacterium]